MNIVFRKPKPEVPGHRPFDWVVFWDSDIAGFVRKVPGFYIGRSGRVAAPSFIAYDEHGSRLGEWPRRIDAARCSVRKKHGPIVPSARSGL